MITKRLLLLLLTAIIFISYSKAQQSNSYLANWKKVEQFEKKGLTKSALTEVLNIYNLSVKDNNDAQQIKACIYQVKYRNETEENSQEKNIFFLDTLIDKAKTPAKNILESMKAEMLWQYLQNNRWKFYNRTILAEDKSNDIDNWSIDKLNNTIATLYKASLANEALLKNINLNRYDAILIKGENTRQLRPSLYDFLAQRAVSYFINDEGYITNPAYAFSIDDGKFFAPAVEFANTSFKTKDTASLYFKAVLLLQDILKSHLNDASPSALIDADLIRIGFINGHAVMDNREKLYEDALKNLEATYPNDSVTAQAIYLRANMYYNRGQKYDPLTRIATQYETKKAKELCDSIIKKYPESEGGINAQNLLNQIVRPALDLQSEKVNIPEQPFRSLVTYKNIDTVYLRIIKTSREEIKKLGQVNVDDYWNEIAKLKPIKEWNIKMHNLQDYQTHSTEIKIDALPNGVYFILASKNAGFKTSKNILVKQQVYISNISFISNNENYYILNRDNGLPLAGTKVQVWEKKYDYSVSKSIEIKEEQYTTDANGYFKLIPTKENREIELQFTNANDELFLDDNIYNSAYDSYKYNGIQQNKPLAFLFTDRSIYRPGQTIYFKGIVVNDSATHNVIPGFKTTVILRDVNFQKVTSLTVAANEFGSYHGAFILPQNLLNGNFSIIDSVTQGTTNFNVEEYKRPKFYVEIQKPKGEYRLGDSVTIIGSAKAYAGNNIDGANVKYTVVREVRYPVWHSFYSARNIFSQRKGIRFPIYPQVENNLMQVSTGDAITDAKGEFKITFKAIPDESIDKKSQPVFNYELNADVTGIDGETRSGNTSVAMAYQALKLNIDVADNMPLDSFKNILVKSTNINDIEKNTIVSLNIQKLKSPRRIFRERYWQQPDQFIMSREEYYNYFPYDIYKDENEIENYDIEKNVYQKTDSTNRQWQINNQWQSGDYKITATTKDKYGEEVTAIKYIELTSPTDTTFEPIKTTVERTTLQPGDNAILKTFTGFKNVWLINTLYRMGGNDTVTHYPLKQQNIFKQIIPITEKDYGGIGLNYSFVQHNRIYSSNQTIDIPWNNKDLNISFNTFRDKLLPGANEKWSVKITGNKNEKVASEMLTTMYDASLDQFEQQSWQKPGLWPIIYFNTNWNNLGFDIAFAEQQNDLNFEILNYEKYYDHLLSINNNLYSVFGKPRAYLASTVAGLSKFSMEEERNTPVHTKFPKPAFDDSDGDGIPDQLDKEPNTPFGNKVDKNGVTIHSEANNADVQIRKNFNETAFFFPNLKTDIDGNIEFSFAMPDALTQWKLMMLAHTKDMATAYTEKTIITQKPLMVQSNAPRFLREGDKMEFTAKIVNLNDSTLTGHVQLELSDAETNQSVDILLKNDLPSQSFTVRAGQSIAIKFPIAIPQNFNSALTYKIIAQANSFSDGEEDAIPVLTNRTLVTESMLLNLRDTNKKEFTFEKLLNSGNNKTLSNHALTVEFTTNPAWYAVQALPYLMDYPYECAEQTFNCYYANTLAAYISNLTPKIKAVFEKWKNTDTTALLSNLQKNEDLKSVLLQETPWVMDAQNENQQKKNIALLFDMVRMSNESTKALDKLKGMQSSNGGFAWFKGGPDDRYITQYILTGIGHLRKLNALPDNEYQKVKPIVDNAIAYLDNKIKEDYNDLIRYKISLKDNNLGYTQIQYLYMRSFFAEYQIPVASQAAYNYYKKQAQKYWLSNEKYMQAMIALALYRTNDNITPKAIIQSLKENAINNEEFGMYWKEWTTGGYYWYQAPIESQALIIEAFSDIDKNISTIDHLKTWLLKQKQTQNWKTTKATAEACYALLLNGSNWLSEEKNVQIQLGDTVIKSNKQTDEAGTAYFKTKIDGDKVKPEMGNISISVTNSTNQSTSWGSVYWQYFEDLDKITPAETPLKLNKKLFIEKNTDKGPVLVAVEDSTTLKIGDKIKVRIELKVDRAMEYIQMKDMRAACMEPTNVISEYKWQDGLGYYESTKDASTNFFFGSLPRGTYVFEYPMFVTHAGNFSNGITTIQCMYAPEFSAHSEGIRVNVKD